MSYAEITFRDRNRVKRFLQRYRLVSAIKLCSQLPCPPAVVCDIGAGNGELCKLLAEYYQDARIICYEPAESLFSEAVDNLSDITGIEFCRDIGSVTPGTSDVVFCLEVFEHLPPEETDDAMQRIGDLLKSSGIVIIGVPVEVGIPALYKGVFRMVRRYGAFDANIRNIALALFGRPPADRPILRIAPGFSFYHEHMGFHFRQFKKALGRCFRIRRVSASPFGFLGAWLMPEVYFVAEKTDKRLSGRR